MTPRSKVQPISVLLRGPVQDAYLAKMIPNLPHDPVYPIEILIREQVKKRKKNLNDAMWAGPLTDIAAQAWHQGRQYAAEEWHEGFKAMFLPDPDAPDFDPSHVTHPETYRKWDINPVTGNRTLVGSTTRLTDPGMHVYLRQMEAFAAQEFEVQFTERAEPQGRSTAA